ncbi:MAG: 3-oxoacyl-[acyl-carrier-protein] reductase [Planctomycetota bacterium]|jgi:3-oxoacyl-[acyl-carrier protein] reductase
MSLEGKVAIVTGASRGIGLAIAEGLAEAGADVVCVATRAESAGKAAAAVEAKGRKAKAVGVDVSDPEATDAIFEAAKELGGCHILVNNAGITRDNLLVRMKPEDWDRVMEVNLRGAFLTTKAAVRPMMKAKFGRIINISSVSGLSGNAGQANYSASKAGLIAFTKTVAKEVASRGITANVVCPGFITTDMTDELSDEVKQGAQATIPLARFGAPEDIAQAVTYLASEQAGYVTGAVLTVDGGLSL